MLACKAPAVDITQPTLPTTLGTVTHTLSIVFLGRWGDFGRATIRRITPTLDNVSPGRWGDFGPSLGIRFIRLSLGAAAVSVPAAERYILTSKPPATTGAPPATAL